MNAIAVASRVFQFCAGPQTHRFYACATCAPKLTDEAPSCFLVIPSQPVCAEDEYDEIPCDLCREG